MPIPAATFIPKTRVTARLVSSARSKTSYLTACGHTPCDGNRFLSREVAPQKFVFVSECRKPHDPTNAVTYVQVAGVPSPGLPTRVRVILSPSAFEVCTTKQCWDFELAWDGSKYAGYSIITVSGGSIPITLVPQFSAGVLTGFHLVFSGTCAPGGDGSFLPFSLVSNCFYPLTLGISSTPLGTIASSCCNGASDTNTSYSANVIGLTPSRYISRLVGSNKGKMVFMFAECCSPGGCITQVACCGCNNVPTSWQFTVSGVTNGTLIGCPGGCAGFNATWTIVYGQPAGGTCFWGVPSSESSGVCTPGSPFNLSCDGTNWILSAQGNTATYQLSVANWSCFGPNTMSLTLSTGTCNNWPATVTLAAV